MQAYIKNLSVAVHSTESLQLKKKAKGKQSSFDPKKPKRLWIYVATEFPAWQQKYIDALHKCYQEVWLSHTSSNFKATNTVDEVELKKKVSSLGTGNEVKHAMVFVQDLKRHLLQRTPGTPMSSVFDRTLIFDEFVTLEEAIPHIKRSAGIADIVVVKLSTGAGGSFEGVSKHGEKVEPLVPLDKTIPGQPTLAFENI